MMTLKNLDHSSLTIASSEKNDDSFLSMGDVSMNLILTEKAISSDKESIKAKDILKDLMLTDQGSTLEQKQQLNEVVRSKSMP
jgi:hypothetical protein